MGAFDLRQQARVNSLAILQFGLCRSEFPQPGFPLGFQVTENRVRQAMKEIPKATLSVLQSMGDVYNLRKFSSAVAEEEDED